MLLISLKTVCDDSTPLPHNGETADIFNDAIKKVSDGHTKETEAQHVGLFFKKFLGIPIPATPISQNKRPAKVEAVEVDSIFLCVFCESLHVLWWPAPAL